MSTATTLQLALTGARKAYDTYADYRDQKVSQTYDALSSAAKTYGPKADDAVESARGIYDDSRDKAGNVTKAARIRLEKALENAEKQGTVALKDARKSGKKLSRKARRKASKAEAKATKRAKKLAGKDSSSHWVRNLSVAALAASGIAALAYTLLSKDKKVTPGTTPPKMEVQLKKASEPEIVEEEAPKLVYSTETPIAAEVETDVLDSEVPLETEVEDELIDDETQAEALQAEFDAKNAPQRDQGEK